jgi:hypothetical protein
MSINGNRRAVADVAMDVTVECMDSTGGLHHIDTLLGYQATDPYAVTMTFLTAGGDLTWTFGRDLLLRGVSIPTGDGDVHVCPSLGVDGRAVVLVELSSPDGHLILQARTQEIADFVDRSLAVVPAGEESAHLDVDALVDRLLVS